MIGKDIKLSLEGNSVLKNGDLDLEADPDQAWTNRILRASKGAWKFDPEIGVGLQDFAGFPNNQETGTNIEQSVVSGLRKVGVEAECTVYPISFDSVAVLVTVFSPDGPKQLNFQFRYDNAKIEYITNEVQSEFSKTREAVNKYDRRHRG